MAIFPERALPKCPAGSIKRIIVHWTGGGPRPSELDREHYHFMVDQEGDVVGGNHSIASNVDTSDGEYAAHTLNCNQGSVGVALCGMLNAREYPFEPGPYPITLDQWDKAAQVVAEICERYGIKPGSRTVLQHGEVQEILGITQRAKWDCCRLPWQPDWTHRQCGDDFRRRVQQHLETSEDAPIPIKASVMGIPTTGILMDSQALVALRPLIRRGLFGEVQDRIVGEDAPFAVEVMIPVSGDPTNPPVTLPFYNFSGIGYVPARALANVLNAEVEWRSAPKEIIVRSR
ncbi:MAG: N-acetylmuramoyl-L-alanine amidase [Fimbriimonas sp.]